MEAALYKPFNDLIERTAFVPTDRLQLLGWLPITATLAASSGDSCFLMNVPTYVIHRNLTFPHLLKYCNKEFFVISLPNLRIIVTSQTVMFYASFSEYGDVATE